MGGELVSKRAKLRAVIPKGSGNLVQDDPDPTSKTALETGIGVAESKLRYLASLPPEAIDENSLYKVSNALSGLVRGLIELKRFELEKNGAIILAFELLKTELRNHLRGNPELCEQLQAEAYTASLKLEEG